MRNRARAEAGGTYWMIEVREVETIENLQGRFNHWGVDVASRAEVDAALAVDQFHLDQTDKIPHMVDALGGALARQLVILAQESGQLEGFEVVGQQHLWGISHDAPPPSKLM